MLGSLLVHHSGVSSLCIWLYMAICSHIYCHRPYICIVLAYMEATVLFHCFLLPYWAARARFGLARQDSSVYIYIYIGSALRASLYIAIYTCIWAIYAQSKPCIHIYGFHIYVFWLHLVVIMHYVLCIYHLACCKLVVLH